MQRNKIIGLFALICIVVVSIIILLLQEDEANKDSDRLLSVTEATDLGEKLWEKYKYDNLIFHEFESPICKVDELYNLEIRFDNSEYERTVKENIEIMDKVIDNFFPEDFDKSFISVWIRFAPEDDITINYNDLHTIPNDEKYNHTWEIMMHGEDKDNSGCKVQITSGLTHIWFSKYGLETVYPGYYKTKVYQYISGKRQGEDVNIKLKDGSVKLSEMEERVLAYLNNDYITEVTEGYEFCISQAMIIDLSKYGLDEYEGICFGVRRKYKDVLFETSSSYQSGAFYDEFNTDCGEITYAESTSPDTIMSMGAVNGSIIEQDTITEIISLDKALDRLSESIGDNSIYDVYGVELVYRETIPLGENIDGIDARLSPKWKIITMNQNDDRYTIFYVDVVTGEITERFEYYYE